ncbi:hypothetical protein K3148_09465 [Qipengyuania aurantiaca]|uniref:Uncharacterized protein n=1 Tax=Qipengyuania aurantiaca TaxID=2867233 RepID=A0ABX8ZJG6_9SPHN|nr:hypothetical protein [Qipengyuania aurantiaca]QZD89064.1 hypothetical protein K3148_09465 [Qipengyuania aurantiaca]
MRKAIIWIAVLAIVGMGLWGYFGGFERVTAGRIESALVTRGVPQPVAACMGTRLSERLTISQLRDLERIGEREAEAGLPTSTVEFLERIRSVEDAELIEVVGTSAAICSFTAR